MRYSSDPAALSLSHPAQQVCTGSTVIQLGQPFPNFSVMYQSILKMYGRLPGKWCCSADQLWSTASGPFYGGLEGCCMGTVPTGGLSWSRWKSGWVPTASVRATLCWFPMGDPQALGWDWARPVHHPACNRSVQSCRFKYSHQRGDSLGASYLHRGKRSWWEIK